MQSIELYASKEGEKHDMQQINWKIKTPIPKLGNQQDLIGGYPSPEGVEAATANNTSRCFLERRRFCWHDDSSDSQNGLSCLPLKHTKFQSFLCLLIKSGTRTNWFISPLEGRWHCFLFWLGPWRLDPVWLYHCTQRILAVGSMDGSDHVWYMLLSEWLN